MEDRSEAERRAIWPCLNVATWRRERSDRAIKQIRKISTAFHSIPAIRSKGSTSVLSTRKIRPIYSDPPIFPLVLNVVAQFFLQYPILTLWKTALHAVTICRTTNIQFTSKSFCHPPTVNWKKRSWLNVTI